MTERKPRGKKPIYPGFNTIPFAVRVHQKHGAAVARLAARLGCSVPEAKRLIVETGLTALQVA